MDSRQLIPNAVLTLGGIDYTIVKTIGSGANAIVYAAYYADNLHPNTNHKLLIKELFPRHPRICRDENGNIAVAPEASDYFELHRNSFMRGNAIHLDVQNASSGAVGANINSYEANGTIYTILGETNGGTLEVHKHASLQDTVKVILSILDAVEIFHSHGVLHLDISPDNILLLPNGSTQLIDYNSAFEVGEIQDGMDVYFSVKEHYSAPEIRLKEKTAVGFATDLFSVCAIFTECITGKPLDFGKLCLGQDPLEPDTPEKVRAIIKKGLKLPPSQRYKTTAEMRTDFEELLESLEINEVIVVKVRKRKTFLMTGLIAAAILLVIFASVGMYNYFRGDYPKTPEEQAAVRNALTAVAESMGLLGRQLQSGENYSVDESYTEKLIAAVKSPRSRLDSDILRELINIPNDYGRVSGWMTDAHSEADSLFSQYQISYANLKYFELQKLILPLNETGRKTILEALPYMDTFGVLFSKSPIIRDSDTLNALITGEKENLKRLTENLLLFGINLEPSALGQVLEEIKKPLRYMDKRMEIFKNALENASPDACRKAVSDIQALDIPKSTLDNHHRRHHQHHHKQRPLP